MVQSWDLTWYSNDTLVASPKVELVDLNHSDEIDEIHCPAPVLGVAIPGLSQENGPLFVQVFLTLEWAKARLPWEQRLKMGISSAHGANMGVSIAIGGTPIMDGLQGKIPSRNGWFGDTAISGNHYIYIYWDIMRISCGKTQIYSWHWFAELVLFRYGI